MFDSEVAELDAVGAAAAAADCFRTQLAVETRQLQLAAHWADLHGETGRPGCRGRPPAGVERLRLLGGTNTPGVGEFAAAELGALFGTTSGAGAHLMADALDLRHRLPRLWSRVLDGQVRGWKARRVAQATRHLTLEQADQVDEAVTGYVSSLPWARFEAVLEARVMEADPAGAEQRARQAEAERFVRAGRSTECGLKLLVARATAGDVIWFLAMVNRIADILAVEGDSSPVDVRRSKAIGILAQPAVALDLLCAHAGDRPDEPSDRSPGWRETGAHGPEADREPDPAATPDPPPAPEPEPEPKPDDPADGGDHRSVVWPRPSRLGQGVEPKRLRPPVTLYAHLSAAALAGAGGVARMEDVGPITLDQVRRFFGSAAQIRIQPVLDPTQAAPVDAYEIPASLREAVRLRTPADAFPYGSSVARSMDLDHTVAYQSLADGGPPGQTRLDNLGPLVRYHHRVRTHGRWRVRQPESGAFVWRSPTGYVYLVDADGTHPLGSGRFARAVWVGAAPPARAPPEQAA